MFLALAGGHGVGQSFNITASTIFDLAVDPLNATAGMIFRSDGGMSSLSPGASDFHDATDWVIPHGANVGALFEVRYTTHSGDALTSQASTENTWIALSSDRTYSLFNGDIGTDSSVQTVEIRRISDSVVVASAIITFTAEVDVG